MLRVEHTERDMSSLNLQATNNLAFGASQEIAL